jgi:hypothetical protein
MLVTGDCRDLGSPGVIRPHFCVGKPQSAFHAIKSETRVLPGNEVSDILIN